jgi:hypothetical protein
MIPFGRVVVMLLWIQNVSTSKQPLSAAAVSWLGYPLVHIIKNVALEGSTAMLYNHIGNSIADVMVEAVFGVLIWAIWSEKSVVKESGKLRDL